MQATRVDVELVEPGSPPSEKSGKQWKSVGKCGTVCKNGKCVETQTYTIDKSYGRSGNHTLLLMQHTCMDFAEKWKVVNKD